MGSLPNWNPTPGFFIALMALGFLVGTAGHVYKSNFAVGLGIAMIFGATVVLPLIAFATD